jgi:hypothetical protein
VLCARATICNRGSWHRFSLLSPANASQLQPSFQMLPEALAVKDRLVFLQACMVYGHRYAWRRREQVLTVRLALGVTDVLAVNRRALPSSLFKRLMPSESLPAFLA